MCKHVLLLCSITLAGGFEAKVAIFYIVHYSIWECHLICLIYAIACVFYFQLNSHSFLLSLAPSSLGRSVLFLSKMYSSWIHPHFFSSFAALFPATVANITYAKNGIEYVCVCVCKVHEITLKLVLFYSCWQHSFKLNQMASSEYSSPTTIAQI